MKGMVYQNATETVLDWDTFCALDADSISDAAMVKGRGKLKVRKVLEPHPFHRQRPGVKEFR